MLQKWKYRIARVIELQHGLELCAKKIEQTAMSFVVKCVGADDPVVVECTFHPQVSRTEMLMAGDPSNLLMPRHCQPQTVGGSKTESP